MHATTYAMRSTSESENANGRLPSCQGQAFSFAVVIRPRRFHRLQHLGLIRFPSDRLVTTFLRIPSFLTRQRTFACLRLSLHGAEKAWRLQVRMDSLSRHSTSTQGYHRVSASQACIGSWAACIHHEIFPSPHLASQRASLGSAVLQCPWK